MYIAPSFKEQCPVVFFIGLGQIAAWGTTYYLPAVISRFIAHDTGWSYAAIMGGISLSLTLAGLLAPRVGRAIDRLGGHILMSYSTLFFALGLCVLAVSYNLFVYYLGWTFIGIGMSCGLFEAAFATAGRILGTGARRAITGITFMSSFSSTAIWPLATWICSVSSWRTACFILAAVQIALVFPLYRFLVPSPPDIAAAKKENPNGNKADLAPVYTFASSPWKDIRFILVVGVVALGTFSIASLIVQILAFLQSIGLSARAAVEVSVWYGIMQASTRLAELVFSKYLQPLWVSRISIFLILCAFAVFSLVGTEAAALGVMLCGAGNGLLSIVRGSLMLATFGPQGYPTRMGLLARPALVAQALAPLAGGFMLTHFGPMPLVAVLATCALCSLSMSWVLGYYTRKAV